MTKNNKTERNSTPTQSGDLDSDRTKIGPLHDEDVDLSQYKIVPGPDEEYLTDKQLEDYRLYRENFIEWLHVEGKDPEQVIGYAPKSIQNTAYRISQFFRYVWGSEGDYTLNITHAHADDFLDKIAYSDKSGTYGDEMVTALKRFFRWLSETRGDEMWEPERTFTANQSVRPPDYLTMRERKLIREVALEYGSIPGYNDLAPGERDRWKAHIATKLSKPKEAVKPRDWQKLNGWKFTSLVWTSLDAGLRPHEVENAVTHWVDVENGILRIPVEDSAKNEENWQVALTERTTMALDNWLDEREQYPKYDDTDIIWLTREANPYASQTLRSLLIRLCEQAGIETEDRKMSWYAIRHSVGTYVVRERDLAAAKSQLRHKRPETTMKYDAVPVEDRRDALNRMG